MSDLKQLNVRLPTEMHRALERHKELTGQDKSDVIRRGIELVLRENETMPASAPEQNGAAAAAALQVEPQVDADQTLERVRALIARRS